MWNKSRTTEESLVILGTLATICASLGGVKSKAVMEFVIAGDYTSLVNYDLVYDESDSVDDLIYARQILALYSKFDSLELGIDRQKAAGERFAQSEQMCRETNRRFVSLRHKPQSCDSDLQQVLTLAVRKIGTILGEVPSDDELNFCFGSGANTNVKSACSMPRAKLSAPLSCSSKMSPTVGRWLYQFPSWAALHATAEDEESFVVDVSVVPGKVIFVPKNAKTDRSICVEPTLNGIIQKGYGSHIRDRLLHNGVDLRDQTRNQKLAALGSQSGALATIDLSMASDCISRELVFELLPPVWSDILDQLITREVTLPEFLHADHRLHNNGGTYMLEKFSSMGNGFTFELESLLFYGLVWGCCKQLGLKTVDVSVYGDDLIVPTGAVALLTRVLAFCGFSVNSEKSFSTGSFRESCGADYFKGFDIRPFYVKTNISDRSLYTIHNWCIRHGERELASCVESLTHPTLRIYGPDGFGDGHLIGPFELKRNRRLRRDGWDGCFFDTYCLKQRRFTRPLPGDSVLPVYSVYTRSGESSPTDPDVVRGSNGVAKMSIYTLQRTIFAAH